MGQRAVDELGEDLLDDRVAAVVFLGLDQDERAVDEHDVVTPDREQHNLIVDSGRTLVGHPAHNQAGGELPPSIGPEGWLSHLWWSTLPP